MKTSLLATTAAAFSMLAASAQADSVDELYNDIMAFKDRYAQSIEDAANATASGADDVKILPIIGAIDTACDTSFELLQNQTEFLRGCLNAVAETQNPQGFNVQGGYDRNEFDILARRLRAIESGNPLVEGLALPPAEMIPGDSSYDTSYRIINEGCPDQFTSFENLTRESCVEATTQVAFNVSNAYVGQLIEASVSPSVAFNQYCRALTLEPNEPQDPHGPWYVEYEAVTACISAMGKDSEQTGQELTQDLNKSFQLVYGMTQSYEDAYAREYPNEDWSQSHRSTNIGQQMNSLFQRNPL